MNLPSRWKKIWQQDKLFQTVVRNTSYLFSSTGISLVLSMVQSIFAGRLLGATQLGILGAITAFATTIKRLFSFRMGELIVKYLGEYLPEEKKQHAGAVVKAAFLVESISSIFAFLILALLAPIGAQFFAKDASTSPLFLFYGTMILGNLISESSIGILQSTNRFHQQAIINICQSILTASIIIFAFFAQQGLTLVLLAYLIGKLILGIGPAVLALKALHTELGPGWWKAPFSLLPPIKDLGRFAISTNLSATLNLLFRDSEILFVNFFLSPTQGGYYKIALAIINLIGIPITPLISTTFPEISRSVAAKSWKQLKHLLRNVTLLSGAWTFLASIVLIFFGNWIILIYGVEYLPAHPALLILLIGYGIANTFFWNRPLLLAFNQPTTPFWVNLCVGLVKISLSFVLIPIFGFSGAAALLSAYLAISVLIMVWRGLWVINNAQKQTTLEGREIQ